MLHCTPPASGCSPMRVCASQNWGAATARRARRLTIARPQPFRPLEHPSKHPPRSYRFRNNVLSFLGRSPKAESPRILDARRRPNTRLASAATRGGDGGKLYERRPQLLRSVRSQETGAAISSRRESLDEGSRIDRRGPDRCDLDAAICLEISAATLDSGRADHCVFRARFT